MHDILSEVSLNFELKRIVFVNSASHGYSEIMLDNHLALFGSNNAGKTASLAATKLMLYPETDFNGCYKKFKFEGKSGQYSKEDSYQFYFPSNKSFMAMEIENDIGTSCVVLYKAGKYQYHRVFLPMPYEQLRPLFWNDEQDCFADDLSIEKLMAFQRKNKGIAVGDDSKRLSELMYHNFTHSDSRYCIVPLSDGSKNAVSAFCSIYQMAFDSNTGSSDSLSDSIATLVEMKRSRSEEKVNANLGGLADEYRLIDRKGDELVLLSNNSGRYESLKNRFETLNDQSQILGRDHAVLQREFINQRASYATDRKAVNIENTEAVALHGQHKLKLDSINNRNNQASGEIKQLQITVEGVNKHILMAEQVMSSYSSVDANELRGRLALDLEKERLSHQALSDSEKTAQRLAGLIQKNNNDKKELETKNAISANIGSLMLNSLSDRTADILLSLNDDLGGIAFSLTDEQKKLVEDFANLFKIDDNSLKFQGINLKNTTSKRYDSAERAYQIRKEIDGLLLAIEKDATEITNLSVTLKDGSGETRRKNIAECEAEIDYLEESIDALRRHESALVDIKQLSAQLQMKQQEYSEYLKEHEAVSIEAGKAKQALDIARTKLTKLNERSESFARTEEALKNISRDIPKGYHSDAEIDEYDTGTLELNNDTLKAMSELGRQLSLDRNNLKANIEVFTRDVPNESVDAYLDIKDLAQMGEVISAYNRSFSTLEYEQGMQDQNIIKHNSIMGSQLKEIADGHQLLTDTIAMINQEMNSHKISNLKQVKLKLKTSPDFDTVYRLYKSYDLTTKSLMSPDFYKSILGYVDKHADKRSGLLKMRDIIQGVTFEYETHDGTVTEKPQSGGTTGTITASVIAILLKRIFLAGSSFRMPIVIDEIGDLDSANTKTIIECIEQHGFSAFCATPEQGTPVCMNVGRWIHVDSSLLECQAIVNGCDLHITPQSIMVWGERSNKHLSGEIDQPDGEVLATTAPENTMESQYSGDEGQS